MTEGKVELARSLEACAHITRAKARNFYYGLRVTPEPRRGALYAIYAWMRRADDLADDALSPEEAARALHTFREATDRALAGTAPATATEPFWPAFAHTMRRYPIERQWLDDVFEGLVRDQNPAPIETTEELYRYCHCVAGTVGMICVSIWGLRKGADRTRALRDADMRGRAFQLTNILRDIGTDFDHVPPRVYVPARLLDSAGLSAADLRAWKRPEACARLVHELGRNARVAFEDSAGLDAVLDPVCAPALRAMSRIYRTVLEYILSHPPGVVGATPVRVPKWLKLWYAGQAAFAGRLARLAPRALEQPEEIPAPSTAGVRP